jgi:DNA polymerase III epsilon subunit-like protein
MLDTETLGLRPWFAVLAIGAVEFQLDGQNDRQFYANVDPKSCTEAGLKRNPNTMAWWQKQPEEAQKALIANRRPLKDVLVSFIDWWRDCRCVEVWSQGAAFDVPIVEAAMDAVGLEPPWKFFNVRDVPRAANLQAHHAAHDALHQVACVATAMRMIRGGAAPDKAGVEDSF